MELVTEKSQRHLKEKIVIAIKKDPRFALFFLGPSLKSSQPFDSAAWAKKVGLEERDARYFESDLLRVGLWSQTAEGLKTQADFLDLGEIKVIEFMTMAMNIFSRVSEDGPCWYEALYVSTTHELKKEFLANINRALKDFITKSQAVPSETIVAWAHGSLDVIKDLELSENSNKKTPQGGPR